MQLQWNKREDHSWFKLHELDLENIEGYGVFVIWRNGEPRRAPAVLYVGRGLLRQALAQRRKDSLFASPALRVTWATLKDVRDLEPIASYLYQRLRPLWGEVLPPSPQPVPVNLPQTA